MALTLCQASTNLKLLKSVVQFASGAVDVVVNFWDWLTGKVKAEITIQNKSNKIAKVMVGEARNPSDFTKVGPGKSITFDLDPTTALVYVTVIIDPDGTPNEMCRNHPCKVGRHVKVESDGTISVK